MFRFFSTFTILTLLTTGIMTAEPLALFKAHCVKCHGQDGKVKGKVDLLAVKSVANLGARPALLEDLIAVLEDRAMPPEDEPTLKESDRKALLYSLRGMLRVAAKEEDFLVTPMRRMNRFQYNNAVVDLLELPRYFPDERV